MNLACFNLIDLSKGRTLCSLNSGDEGSSRFLKDIMRIAFLMLILTLFNTVRVLMPQFLVDYIQYGGL